MVSLTSFTTRHPLTLAIGLTLGTLSALPVNLAVAAESPATSPATRSYDVPAGPLGAALSRFAAQSGVLLSFDPALTADKTSAGLQGSYTFEEGFARLLQGSDLSSERDADGGYRLHALSPTASGEPLQLQASSVVGDWLGSADALDVYNHPGARDVIRRETFEQVGASSAREVLNRIPGVNAPENNGTGSHDLALNFGIRGLNPRLASRSTVLMDGIPVPFAPYGQPQLSLAPISLGNMDAIDVVRGGGAVRYGPQNVGGIVNFVTRAIPDQPTIKGGLQTEVSPSSSQDGFKKTGNLLIGGSNENGLGGALLYSGTRGSDWREHSDTQIDDLILKGKYSADGVHTFSAMGQYYEGEADMPGGLSTAAFDADPYQSTRPYDSFWGRRTLASASYSYTPDADRELSVTSFFTKTLRSGFLDQGSFLSLSPREYWVRGIETRYSQAFDTGALHHEMGVGYRYVSEESHEERFRNPASTGVLPSTTSLRDRNSRGETEASAVYIDDRIDIGNWTITPGVRYEKIASRQDNKLNGSRASGEYTTALPALNVLYRVNDRINLYANTEGSFGAVQYSQMGKALASGDVEPEKARTWELGTRYDDGLLQAEIGAFLINFDNQYESNQQTNDVTARGETRHRGVESSLNYALEALNPALSGLSVYATYTFVDAEIRENGPNKGNQVPFSSRHKGVVGARYETGPWQWSVDGSYQSSQFADNANTKAENAAGNNGEIPGYMVWGLRGAYDFGPQLSDLTVAAGIKNVFAREYYTRSFDDNNSGKYLGQPRTVYLQTSLAF